MPWLFVTVMAQARRKDLADVGNLFTIAFNHPAFRRNVRIFYRSSEFLPPQAKINDGAECPIHIPALRLFFTHHHCTLFQT